MGDAFVNTGVEPGHVGGGETQLGAGLHQDLLHAPGGERGDEADLLRYQRSRPPDLSHHRPKSFADLVDTSFDLVVSLTPEAHHQALKLAEGKAMDAIYWPTPDPTLAEGSRDQVVEAYRAFRDELRKRIRERFA